MKTFYGWNLCVRNESENWKSQQALELLNPDHWMNWSYDERGKDYPGFVPTIWSDHVYAHAASVRQAMIRHNANTWLFLNEGHISGQANMSPDRTVKLAFWLLNLAREASVDINWCGPNASVNYGAEPGGLSGKDWWREWLRLLRRSGIPRPSAHGIHMYHSTDKRMFEQTWNALIREWRWQWIGDGPVIITEMCAENQPLPYQIEVMDAAFKVLETGLKEGPAGRNGAMGVFWFAATNKSPWHCGDWPNCALAEPDPDKVQTMRLTPLGKHWKALQERLR